MGRLKVGLIVAFREGKSLRAYGVALFNAMGLHLAIPEFGHLFENEIEHPVFILMILSIIKFVGCGSEM